MDDADRRRERRPSSVMTMKRCDQVANLKRRKATPGAPCRTMPALSSEEPKCARRQVPEDRGLPTGHRRTEGTEDEKCILGSHRTTERTATTDGVRKAAVTPTATKPDHPEANLSGCQSGPGSAGAPAPRAAPVADVRRAVRGRRAETQAERPSNRGCWCRSLRERPGQQDR